MRGGWTGARWAAAWSAVSALAVPLLFLPSVFGVLVVTATPVTTLVEQAKVLGAGAGLPPHDR
jgi:S-DNA-T family DNA segregation ATPase FtsK/SpoIIIE